VAPGALAALAAPAAPAAPATEATAPQSTPVDTAPAKLSFAATPTTSPTQLLILVVLVLGAAVGLLLFRRRTVNEQQLLDVVATRVIGRGKQLVVVDTGEARLLLAVTDQGINVLSSSPSHAQTRESFSRNDAHHQYTHQPEAGGATSSIFKGVGNKIAGLWGRTPSGPPADWDNFDRILASAAPEQGPPHAAPDMPASQSRRSTERPSTTSSADLTELTRELRRHGTRRSA
jgi:flagellar biogenesis protein FliO